MENEICENCGRAIGKLEQAFVHKGHIVCKDCNKKLRDELQETRPCPVKARQTTDVSKFHIPKPLPKKSKSLKVIGWLLIILSIILGLAAESAAVFGLLLVAGVTSLLYARRRKKTRSKSLWFAFAGWSVLFVMLILGELMFYANEIATRTHAEQFDVKWNRFDPDKAAASFWFFILAVIWFLGALPLFIAAIVTRKDKK